MYRWIAAFFLGIFFLPLAPITAQEFYESPYVILVQATKCTHNSGTTRFQTGFRVQGMPGIFTALHGLADCDSIYTLSGSYQPLTLFEVDVDHDVVRLCNKEDLGINVQTQQPECISDSPDDGFAPAAETNEPLPQLKIVGHPAGSPGQYTIESIKAGKTSTYTLGSLVGPTLAMKLEARRSPLPNIRVIPLEGALAAGLSGAPVLTADDQLIGIGDGSQAEGLSWLIPWSELQLNAVEDAQARLDQLRNLSSAEFFLSATTNQAAGTDYVIYRGVVRSSSQNQSLPDAKVIVRLADQFHRVYTDADGEFLVRLRASADNEQLPGTVTVEKDGYVIYTDNIDDLLQQEQWQDIRLTPMLRPRPTTLRRGVYVRVAVLEGANYYQSYTTNAPIGSFAPNVVLALVNGPEQSQALIWWQVRRLEAKVETAVWMPVVEGPTVYVEAIARLGRGECVSTIDRMPFYEEAGIDASFVMVEANSVLRVMNSQLIEKDDALWVQVERVDSAAEQGWVEYAGTGGVNLELEGSYELVTPPPPTFTATAIPTATPQPTVTATLTATITPLSVTPTLTETLILTFTPQLMVEAASVNIRSGPGTVYNVIGGANKGDEFSVVGRNQEGDWWQICCVQGQQGWIYGGLTTVTNTDRVPMAQNIPTPPSKWINPKDGATYVFIPAGTFTMGSSEEQIQYVLAFCGEFRSDCQRSWFEDEPPQHTINVNSFWIMQTEVTNKMYVKCIAQNVCSNPKNNRWADPQYAEYPVTDVDWNQARIYAQWAGGRLPTEAEWEKAARGSNAVIFPWGNVWDSNKVNSQNIMPAHSLIEGASPYKLLHTAGNVWEWTNTLYRPYPYVFDDRESVEGNGQRTIRGGSFNDFPPDLRTANRNKHIPTFEGQYVKLCVKKRAN